MGGSKPKVENKQTTANTYEYKAPPVTQEITDAKAVANNLRGEINPIIRSQYAGARKDLDDSFQNPLGQYTTPAIRDATLRSGHENLRQAEGSALAAAEFAASGTDFERQMAIAGLTNPQLVQTGGTQTGTQTQSGGPGVLGSLIGGVAQMGGAALGNPALM